MRLLLLAGTPEARRIAVALARESFLNLTVSLRQAERRPQTYGWPVRIGGWGGEEPFRAFLEREQVEGIIDATHPFALEMTERASRVATDLGIPFVQFLRPAWTPTDGDNWVFLNNEGDAAHHIPEGARVFLATGRHRLEQFSNLRERQIFCRIREPATAPFPYPEGGYLFQQGPFDVVGEMRLFRKLGVDWVVTRNSGGTGSLPKIEAARELGLPVAMIRRPKQVASLKISTVAETLAWVRRRL